MKPRIVCCWILLALAIGLAWYNHQYHCYGYPFLTTPSGLSYKARGQGNGRKAKDGEWVEVSLVMKSVAKKETQGKDSASADHFIIEQNEPIVLPFNASFQSAYKPLAEMIGMMQEKQQMIFKCSAQYGLEEEDAGRWGKILKQNRVNKEDELVTHIKLDKIMTDEAYKERMEAARSADEANHAAQLAKDKQLIVDYLAKEQIEASSTDSGLFYVIDQPSQSTPVTKGKKIKVHYTGKLLDGKIFDTSLEGVAKANNIYNAQRPYMPFEFQVGIGRVIQGWDQGLLLLKKGEKARLFIPSALAYGEGGYSPSIPGNAVLLFEVEVVDVL